MRFKIFLLMPFAGLAAFAASQPLMSFCQPFNGSATKVIWKAATNGIPTSAKIFKVVPTTYSVATISNLLQIAGLGETNKKRDRQSGILSGKDLSTYANKGETRHLDLVPSQGAVALHRADVIAGPRDVVAGVPDATGVVAKTFDLLPILGIKKEDVALIIGKPSPFTFFEQADVRKDKTKNVTNVVSRGMSLSRQIDGIPTWGSAGVLAVFGNGGKLAELISTWHSMKPSNVCPVPTAASFVTRIKAGRTLIRNEQAGLACRKLTINQVRLYYWENDGSEQQSIIFPFAVLDAETDLPGENSNVQLFVPFAND